MATPPDDIKHVPPPWTLKGTVYVFAFWTSKDKVVDNRDFLYSPLEANSDYASPEGSTPQGGVSTIQILRYTESPVGPYDELILIPGFHEYTVEENGRRVKKRNARISRIYVSQKYTCWNGRTNWNIPKHLAGFEWDYAPDGTTTVKVFPHDTTGDVTEASASRVPFFQGRFKPMPLVPSFPLSTKLLGYIGLDATLAQPPLPEGKGASQGELPGTERWCAIVPGQSTRRATLGWVDARQEPEQESKHGNFWPGIGRWHVGIRMEDSTIEFGEGRYWDAPKSVL